MERELWRERDIRKFAMRTCSIPYDQKNDRLCHAVLGQASKAGEAAGVLQKKYQGHEVDLGYMEQKLGDRLWMITEVDNALGTGINEVVHTNMDKLKVHSPEGFAVENLSRRKAGDV